MKKNNFPVKASKQVRLFTAVTAVVVVIAVVLSLLLSAAPSSIMEYDLTANDLYGITYQTEELLDSLEYDIDITVVTEMASLDERFIKFMEKYDALSDKVTVTYADPVLQPSVSETYGTDGNDIIVECEETGRRTSFAISGFSGYESAALLYDYNYYYTYGSLNLTAFDAEGQLAAAITNVISESNEKIYYFVGHGESTMATAVEELITKANYDTAYLDLLTTGSIPEDCSLIICNAPTTDMSDNELAVLKRWLADGGDMILICDDPSLTNFNALMVTYGVQMEQGYLADLSNYYEAYVNQFGYYCFWPILNTENGMADGITANAMVFSARPLSIVTPERRAAVTESIMSSSPYGVNYIDDNNMTEGTFYTGVLSTEAVSDTETTRFAVISSSMFINEQLLTSFASVSNKNLFMNIVNANFEGKTVMTIPARTTALEMNTVSNSTMWGLFFAAMVPAIFIIAGFVFWTQRRKK
ncbi:MAG: Gldg family protein [Oscillospiraceae bacterium]|nr:Gldg family protein [Oscillospiraceae bacterium]